MAKPFYKKITSVLGFFLFALLIASFAFFGAGSLLTQQGTVVATVGDQTVTLPEFSTTFQSEVARYREQFGPEFDTQQALLFGLDKVVINQMVQRASLDQEVEDLGLLGSSVEVRTIIRDMEAFHDISGNFSDLLYRQRIANFGLTAEEFETTVRVDIARNQLIKAVAETAIIPQALVTTLYNYRKESRRAKIVTIPASTISDIGVADAETLQTFYELNKNSFAAPEFRDLTFLVVDTALFAKKQEFTEEELQVEYDFRFEEFNIAESRTVAVAVLKEENQARELFDRVQGGEDFIAVAVEISGFTADELVLGEQTKSQIIDNYSAVAAERVFSVALDGVTQPTQSLISWQVFHVSGITEGLERPLEDVRGELIQLLAEEQGIDDLYSALAAIDDEIASGSNLEEISVAAGIPLIHVPATSNLGQDIDGNLIAERALPYLAMGFSNNSETPLELYPVEDRDVFYMVVVNGITPPMPFPLEQVTDRVQLGWRAQQQLAKSREYANQALAAAKAGTALEVLAETYGGIYFETEAFRRDRVFTQRELSPGIARLMFSLEEGAFGVEADARGDGYLILQVSEIKIEDPANDQFEYLALLTNLQVELQNDLFTQLKAAIQKDLDIVIYQNLIDVVFDSDRQVGAGRIR